MLCFCREWHEVDYTKPSPCSSPLFPLHASRWACFQLQTERQERWSTHSGTRGRAKQINWLTSGGFIESPMNQLFMMQAELAILPLTRIETSATQRYSLFISLSNIPVLIERNFFFFNDPCLSINMAKSFRQLLITKIDSEKKTCSWAYLVTHSNTSLFQI